MCLHIPAIQIENKLFRNIYKRGDSHYTSYFQFGKLAYYWIMFLLGPTFVNIITLENVRETPIADDHNCSSTFIITASIVAPVTYFVSGIVCLRGQYDLNEYFQLGKCGRETYTKK